jgi:uncharacterized coiled-coil DUF342 family protein
VRISLSVTTVTQANDPNEYDRTLDRRYRNLNRRVERLEDTQLTAQEFTRSFDRVYDEMDALRGEVREVRSEIGEVRTELRELNGKFDLIMRYITGQQNQ